MSRRAGDTEATLNRRGTWWTGSFSNVHFITHTFTTIVSTPPGLRCMSRPPHGFTPHRRRFRSRAPRPTSFILFIFRIFVPLQWVGMLRCSLVLFWRSHVRLLPFVCFFLRVKKSFSSAWLDLLCGAWSSFCEDIFCRTNQVGWTTLTVSRRRSFSGTVETQAHRQREDLL